MTSILHNYRVIKLFQCDPKSQVFGYFERRSKSETMNRCKHRWKVLIVATYGTKILQNRQCISIVSYPILQFICKLCVLTISMECTCISMPSMGIAGANHKVLVPNQFTFQKKKKKIHFSVFEAT